MKLSGIIITKNEEKMIEKCLKSLDFCDEIVVVDSGSNDRTIEIAQAYTNKIFKIEFSDFSSLRNFAKDKATGDWLLYVDADERVSVELKEKILSISLSALRNSIQDKLQRESSDFSGFEIKRNNNFLGKWMNHGGWENEYLLRLMKKDKLNKWFGRLHETAEVEGKIGKIEAPILHFSHRNLSSMVEKTNEWSETEAEARFKNNHPKMTTLRFFKLFFKEFFMRLILRSAWRDGIIGVIEAIYQSYSLLITYFKLWEKQNNTKSQ